MSWNSLKTDIKTLLDTITDIQDVSSKADLNFLGFPAVTISKVSLNNEVVTSRENMRTYLFNINVFQETRTVGMPEAVNIIEEIGEKILDKLDQEEQFNSTRIIGDSLSGKYHILMIEPISYDWEYLEEQELVILPIGVSIKVSYLLD